MEAFIKNMWVLRRITSTQVNAFATKGIITKAQAKVILACTQVALDNT